MLLQSHDNAVHLLPALPDDWREGEVKGLQARGAFTVDMAWSEGKLQQATITSKIGGTLRLRSYVPLQGNGLRKASGACPNPLFASPETRQPLHSEELTEFPLIPLKEVFEYDIDTTPGQVITVSRQ
jgi:alpha-L-fucosidase 2